MRFGDYFKQKRLGLGLTLRKFSETKGADAAYVSRMENNIIPAPADQEKLKGFALALDIKEGTPDWVTFFDLAAASRGVIPADIRERVHTPDLLPAFYRALRKDDFDKAQIEDLLKLIDGTADEPAQKYRG